MTGPPATRPAPRPSIRHDEKEGRAAKARRHVRVVSAFGVVEVCTEERARRVYGSAPNTEFKFTHGGKLVAIWLQSVGDDRSHSGERHGRSTKTTYLEKLESSAPIIQHKHNLPEQPIAGTVTTSSGAALLRACLRRPGDFQGEPGKTQLGPESEMA